MTWIDDILARAKEAKPAEPSKPAPRQIVRSEPPPEIKTVWIQTQAPRGDDPGAGLIGYYSVQGNIVVMHDDAGQKTGRTIPIENGEDPQQAASRMARAQWEMTSKPFNRRLDYQPFGVY